MGQKKLPLTDLPVGNISADVIVCGDPGRATKIAAFLEDAALLADKREYRSFNGLYEGHPITVCSHGIGAPGAAIDFGYMSRRGGAQGIISKTFFPTRFTAAAATRC